MMNIISKTYVDQYDIDYRIKNLMKGSEQDLMDELCDGSRQKFIEATMSCQPIVHKERVDFLCKTVLSYKGFSEKVNSCLRLIVR